MSFPDLVSDTSCSAGPEWTHNGINEGKRSGSLCWRAWNSIGNPRVRCSVEREDEHCKNQF